MKRILSSLCLVAMGTYSLHAQVYINEVLANPPGSDSTATAGNELFELRGTPNLSLTGYYLLSIEGQGAASGDVNQFFDFTGVTLGANGYLFGRQFGSPYTTVDPGATLLANATGQGWGQANTATGSSVGHSSDGTQVDLENSATTMLLINIGAGAAPTLTTDVDTDNNGVLDLPAGWTVVDSVGIMDGVSALAADFSYGAVTLRLGGVGTAVSGTLIDVPGSGTGFYVGRIGESTGSTAADWFGSVVTGSAGNFTLSSASDPRFTGKLISDMVFGGPNPVPEPGTLAIAGLGLLAVLGWRRNR